MSQHEKTQDMRHNELELVEFYIDEAQEDGSVYRGYYGMNVAKVLEIIRQPEVTVLPGQQHPALRGTFNLRGKVMPLVDLAAWLDREMLPEDSRKVIVSEYSGVVTAFLVSGVTRIRRLDWQQVEAPGKYLQAYSAQSITGVVRIEDRILFILDMEQLISVLNPNLDMGKMLENLDIPESEMVSTENFHILLADDSQSIRTIISRALGKAGYSISLAQSGADAWTQLCAWRDASLSEGQPLHKYVDVLISDIEMPEMDGFALTRKVKADQQLQALPVVLFSSLFTDHMREMGLQAGADYQLSKPDLPDLTKLIRNIINQAHGK